MFGKTGKDHPFLGKTHTTGPVAKISLARKGIIHIDVTKEKMSAALRGEKNPMSKNVFVYSFDSETKETGPGPVKAGPGILYKSFLSCSEVALYFNCSARTISSYLNKNKLYKKQWILTSSEKST